MQDTPEGFEIVLTAHGATWTWTLRRPTGIAAQGEAADPETARRSGLFAAFAVSALARVGARRF
ncbi:hypothetical protein [Phenylobacterium sp.]|uniref:hypothetical protein n=1 Tax=Phenylobacterium sp. TaxID=1871053 RepID=UPI00286A5EB9|nr:hypothetical protein [Phenylobacterium sp.]